MLIIVSSWYFIIRIMIYVFIFMFFWIDFLFECKYIRKENVNVKVGIVLKVNLINMVI